MIKIQNNKSSLYLYRLLNIFFLALVSLILADREVFASSSDYVDLGGEQAAEKVELQKMRQELKELKATTNEALDAMSKVDTSPLKEGLAEFHLFCQQSNCEIMPGKIIECLGYNGLLPGPILKVKDGQLVRITVHNQLGTNTSFHIHGMVLPESVDGLPNSQSGLIKPGQAYVYQFVAKGVGTYWYHPQIMHAEQKTKGLYGTLIVEPAGAPVKTVDRDIVIIISDMTAAKIQSVGTTATNTNSKYTATIPGVAGSPGKPVSTFYLVNGKTAPAIPAIEVRPNTRIRLRIINAGQHSVPLHITGHKFEVVSLNGNLTGEQTSRDTITVGVSDHLDLEFTANNPGVWSIGSELIEQSTNNGQFPSGFACILRYVE